MSTSALQTPVVPLYHCTTWCTSVPLYLSVPLYFCTSVPMYLVQVIIQIMCLYRWEIHGASLYLCTSVPLTIAPFIRLYKLYSATGVILAIIILQSLHVFLAIKGPVPHLFVVLMKLFYGMNGAVPPNFHGNTWCSFSKVSWLKMIKCLQSFMALHYICDKNWCSPFRYLRHHPTTITEYCICTMTRGGIYGEI